MVDAGDPKTMAIGISSAGVYETTDGGKTWTRHNEGLGSPTPQGPEGDYT